MISTYNFKSISKTELEKSITISQIVDENILSFNEPLLKVNLPEISNSLFANITITSCDNLKIFAINKNTFSLNKFQQNKIVNIIINYPNQITTHQLNVGKTRLPEGHSFSIEKNILKYSPKLGNRLPVDKESLEETIQVFTDTNTLLKWEKIDIDEDNNYTIIYPDIIYRAVFFLCKEVSIIQKEIELSADFSPEHTGINYRAKELYHQQKYQKALELFLNPDNNQNSDEYNLNLGITYYYLQDYNQANNYFEKHLAENPKDYSIIHLQANAATHLGKFKKAEELFALALSLTPKQKSFSLLSDMGMFYSQRTPNLAKAYLEKAVSLNPDAQNNNWYFLASIYEMKKENTKALNAYHNLYRIFPNYNGASNSIYMLNMKEKKYDEAESILENDIKSGTGDKALNYFKLVILNYLRYYKDDAKSAMIKCLDCCNNPELLWCFLVDEYENLIEAGFTIDRIEKIKDDLKEELKSKDLIANYQIKAACFGSDDIDEGNEFFELEERIDIIGGSAYSNGHFILLVEAAIKLLKKAKEECLYNDSIFAENGLEIFELSFNLLNSKNDVVESQDEQQLFNRTVWEESFNETVLKFTSESKNCRYGARVWANEEFHSGVFGMEQLTLHDIKYLPDYVNFIRAGKKDYEPWQSEFSEKLIEKYGWCEETLGLITSRIYSTAGQCGQDQFVEYMEKGLKDYLVDDQNRFLFIQSLMEELFLYQKDHRKNYKLSKKKYLDGTLEFFSHIPLEEILTKREFKIFKNNIYYWQIAEQTVNDLLCDSGYFDEEPCARLHELIDEYINVDGLIENGIDYNTEDLKSAFNEKDEYPYAHKRRWRVATEVYRAVLKNHGITKKELIKKEADILVSKYLKKEVKSFNKIDVNTYEPSTFDYWEIKEFTLTDTIGDLAILKNLQKLKKLTLDMANPSKHSKTNQQIILKKLPTFLKELKVKYNFTSELANTLFSEAKLSSLEVLDLSESRHLTTEHFVNKEFHLPNLKELNMAGCKLSSRAIVSILESLPPYSLKILNLNQNNLGLAGIEILTKSKKLEKLEELYLEDNNIPDKEISSLLYKIFKSLKKLSL